MQTIYAIWKDGVFTPDTPVDLAEGIQVEMQIVPAGSVKETKPGSRPYPLPDPPFESECRAAPFDLPMPSGGKPVKARMKNFLRPDAHDLEE
ncbi:MAG TPA: antitoxin family protein [Pirellulaceae bacterium]|nr:antitoxin family protein [Pirellulaceae bacterium]